MNDFKMTVKLSNSEVPFTIPNSTYLEIVDWGIETESNVFWCYVHDSNVNTVYLYIPVSNIDYIASNVPITIN